MGEKTESATAKRRGDERRKGNVFKSQDLILLASLLAVIYTLQFMGDYVLGSITNTFQSFWAEAAWRDTFHVGSVTSLFFRVLVVFAICVLPPLLMAGLANIIGTFAQTRGLVTASKLKPNFGALNPISGIKKMFSLRGLVELLKSIAKIAILGFVIYNKYLEHFPSLPRLMEMEFIQVLGYAGDFVMDIVSTVAIIFAFLVAADYMYQRWQYERDMRMSKEEVKQEYKQTEGDPKIKAKIRQKQMQMAMSRMMQGVPKADVVIRNPTHYAVAVQYEAEKNSAPVVLAKGTNLVALRIVKLAEENGVIVVENKPLARGLYENVPLDKEIPPQFFQPMAEVLAFVYSTGKKHKLPKVPASH